MKEIIFEQCAAQRKQVVKEFKFCIPSRLKKIFFFTPRFGIRNLAEKS